MTEWQARRDGWVRTATAEELLAVIALVAANADLDENAGDVTERAGTLLWLATRGEQGREWGHAAAAVRQVEAGAGR